MDGCFCPLLAPPALFRQPIHRAEPATDGDTSANFTLAAHARSLRWSAPNPAVLWECSWPADGGSLLGHSLLARRRLLAPWTATTLKPPLLHLVLQKIRRERRQPHRQYPVDGTIHSQSCASPPSLLPSPFLSIALARRPVDWSRRTCVNKVTLDSSTVCGGTKGSSCACSRFASPGTQNADDCCDNSRLEVNWSPKIGAFEVQPSHPDLPLATNIPQPGSTQRHKYASIDRLLKSKWLRSLHRKPPVL